MSQLKTCYIVKISEKMKLTYIYLFCTTIAIALPINKKISVNTINPVISKIGEYEFMLYQNRISKGIRFFSYLSLKDIAV